MADSLGDAFISVHADTDPFHRELDDGLSKSAKDAEKTLDKSGKDMGDTMADAMTVELGKHGRDFGKSIEDSIGRETVTVRPRVRYNVRDSRGRFTRSFGSGIGDEIVDEIGDALAKASGPGGPFSKIGQAMADAIGAGFNISGRSPLIALLIPALAAILGLILAAVQAANALVAILGTAPSVIAGIGLSVATVMFAIDGINKAMSKAFEATNAQELEDAVQGLTPAAQSFVKSMYPFRTMLDDLKRIAQENLFKSFGDQLAKTLGVLRPLLGPGFARLASALGTFFGQLAEFFRSPIFVKFVRDIFPSTARWLGRFGPAFVTLLEGLIAVADASLPFLEKVGGLLSGNLEGLGYFLKQVVNTPGFKKWLDDMLKTIDSLFTLFASVIDFLAVFMDTLNKAGGQKVIDELVKALFILSAFLQSEAGQKAMEGMINLAIIGIAVFTGLIMVVLSIIAIVEAMSEAIAAFFSWLTGVLGDFFDWVSGLWSNLEKITKERTKGMVNAIKNIPTQIKNFFINAKNLLIDAGRNIIQGLINGIKSQLHNLWMAMKNAMGIVGDFLPGSPAKEGPLSGSGYSRNRGQRMMQDFISGLMSEAPALRNASAEATSNVVFNPGAIRMEFNGATPSQAQARSLGTTVGTTAAGIIAQRNTRLAVRAL